jgi:hypothetical protein
MSIAVGAGGGIAQANIASTTIAAFGATFAQMVITCILGAVNADLLGRATANITNKNTDFHE